MDNIDQILKEKQEDTKFNEFIKQFNLINNEITKKQNELENLDKKRSNIINDIKSYLKIEN